MRINLDHANVGVQAIAKTLTHRVAKTCQPCQPAGANFSRTVLIFGQSTRKTSQKVNGKKITEMGTGSTGAKSTGASSSSAGSTGAGSIGAVSTVTGNGGRTGAGTSAGSTGGVITSATSTSCSSITVTSTGATSTLNKNGIYAVLSQIWKCRKSRVFGANFLGQKIGWC